MGNKPLATADFARAVRLDAMTTAKAFLGIGNWYLDVRRLDEANAAYTATLRLNSRSADALYGRGFVHIYNGEHDLALADITEAIGLEPNNKKFHHRRSLLWCVKRDFKQALADIDMAIKIDPLDVRIITARAAMNVMCGNYLAGLGDFATVYKCEPGNDGCILQYALALAVSPDEKSRDGKRAVELATHVCEKTNWQSGPPLSVLAAAYAEIGDFAKAVELQAKAMAIAGYTAGNNEKMKVRLKQYQARQPRRFMPDDFQIELIP